MGSMSSISTTVTSVIAPPFVGSLVQPDGGRGLIGRARVLVDLLRPRRAEEDAGDMRARKCECEREHRRRRAALVRDPPQIGRGPQRGLVVRIVELVGEPAVAALRVLA